MRGKANAMKLCEADLRITPAYAGKSSFASCSFASFRDHPRLCGEKLPELNGKRKQSGSPPPMRGKGIMPTASIFSRRITPAYAGKSVTVSILMSNR